jgi:hypothetical protein
MMEILRCRLMQVTKSTTKHEVHPDNYLITIGVFLALDIVIICFHGDRIYNINR